MRITFITPVEHVLSLLSNAGSRRYGGETGYVAGLSPASAHSLQLQGDMLNPEQACAFLRSPHAADAVLLRRWDGAAKDPAVLTPGLDHYRPFVAAHIGRR